MSAKSKGQSNSRNNAEQADDLKRRARRRLMGAIALFLTALVVVPSIIETEPQQTLSPIELVVPGRPTLDTLQPSEQDAGIQPESSSVAPGSSQESPGELGSSRDVVQVRPEATEASVPKLVTKNKTEAERSSGAESGNKSNSEPEPLVAAKQAKQSSQATKPMPPKTAPVAEPEPTSDPIERFAQADVFWVQVVALRDKRRAEDLRDKLSAAGFEGRIESVSTDVGTVYRVRVGPLAGQRRASETKTKLKQAGYEGRIVQ